MLDLEAAQQKLKQNLIAIKQRIEQAAIKSGRNEADVTLVAVSKYVDASMTRNLLQCGQKVLGESRPQVLWDKAEQLKDDSVQWHFIGSLQRNKARKTVPLCHLIHSVDSMRLLRAIDAHGAEQQRRVPCLLQVNVSGESAKHGFDASEMDSVVEAAADLENIQINGLMAMASLHGDAQRNRREFAKLRELRDKHSSFSSDSIHLNELSMGMSRDFEAAIEEGSTIVRIGSVLFDGIRD